MEIKWGRSRWPAGETQPGSAAAVGVTWNRTREELCGFPLLIKWNWEIPFGQTADATRLHETELLGNFWCVNGQAACAWEEQEVFSHRASVELLHLCTCATSRELMNVSARQNQTAVWAQRESVYLCGHNGAEQLNSYSLCTSQIRRKELAWRCGTVNIDSKLSVETVLVF